MGDPWLSIIGLGEDGLDGLTPASRAALDRAEILFGGRRHLTLVGRPGRTWPVPFDIAPVLALKGRRVAVLTSGDPFWHGAGSILASALDHGEWMAFPAPSTFSLAAARLGWRLEDTACVALHAAPFEKLRLMLARGWRGICLMRDGEAVGHLAVWLTARGWGDSQMTVLEALGGPRERIRRVRVCDYALDPASPVAVAIEAIGGFGLSPVPGLADDLFTHDGQITKAPVRALTISALAPRMGEMLWDLGAGSGSVSIEWALAGGRAVAVEARPDRAANIRANVASFGLGHRIDVIEGHSADVITELPAPDAIFVGGGFDAGLYRALPCARLVVNAVTLETQALLTALHGQHGGELLRIDLARAEALGRMQGWTAARSVVQWSRPCG